MVTYMTIPQQRISTTHGGSTYYVDATAFNVIRRENGWDTATVVVENTDSKNYSSKVSADDPITIEVKDASEAAWTTLSAQGIITAANPHISNSSLLQLKVDGAGYGLARMNVAAEYGSDSAYATRNLDTILEILTNAAEGIIPEYLNDILNTGVASGYSYTNTIEDVAGAIRYIYFPYKPVDKCINDLCELLQAIKGTNAGPHWIVKVDNTIILSTIGSHHAAAITDGWTTYYGGSQAAATVVQGLDFTNATFKELGKEANYVLYYGRLKKPSSEAWTEANAASWGKVETIGTGDSAIADDNAAGDFVIGNYSVQCTTESGAGGGTLFYYPSTLDLNLDITKIGGPYEIPTVSFYVKKDANIGATAGATPLLYFYTTNLNNYYDATIGGYCSDRFTQATLPIGPYAGYVPYNSSDIYWGTFGNPDWANIDAIGFGFMNTGAAQGVAHIDGLYINGRVVRVARQTAAFSAADPCKMKIITDDVGKDDLLRSGTPGTTDQGTIALLAKAEYLRCSTTPLVGSFTTEMIKDLWPGMLLHVHGEKKADGTFNVDCDMRVQLIEHQMSGLGYNSKISVTSDVVNSHARSAYNALNRVLADARPEFQDRQATSIKMREIDIFIDRLIENY